MIMFVFLFVFMNFKVSTQHLFLFCCLLEFLCLRSQSTSLCSCHCCCCAASLTICYKAILYAPVTIYNCLRARGKGVLGNCALREEKKEMKTGRENVDEDADGVSTKRKQKTRVTGNIEQTALFISNFPRLGLSYRWDNGHRKQNFMFSMLSLHTSPKQRYILYILLLYF